MAQLVTLELAHRYCEGVARSRAANFYYGVRLLPAAKRRAMCAVYGFARRVDDIGDGDLGTEDKQRELELMRQALDTLGRTGGHPVLLALDDARRRFSLPMDALRDLIDGVEMDVVGTHYERFDDLLVYCRRVAGSIGRLCVAVFGSNDPRTALPLSDDLGVALQLTNILRDVGEDLAAGRTYLPAEDLRRFRCEDLAAADPEAVAALVRFETLRGREWFERGQRLISVLDRRSASCAAAMSGIYRRILRRIELEPTVVLHRRVSLPPWEKAWVAARCVALADR